MKQGVLRRTREAFSSVQTYSNENVVYLIYKQVI